MKTLFFILLLCGSAFAYEPQPFDEYDVVQEYVRYTDGTDEKWQKLDETEIILPDSDGYPCTSKGEVKQIAWKSLTTNIFRIVYVKGTVYVWYR